LQLVQGKSGNTLETKGKDFLRRILVVQKLIESMDKWEYMELNSFCPTIEIVSTLKIPTTKWEKIFASCISD
jgi:hypothetical protein